MPWVTSGWPAWPTTTAGYILGARKANIDADALSRVSWSRFLTYTMEIHHQGTAAAVWAVQDAALENLPSPIDAYSCNLHMDSSGQVSCMNSVYLVYKITYFITLLLYAWDNSKIINLFLYYIMFSIVVRSYAIPYGFTADCFSRILEYQHVIHGSNSNKSSA